MENIYPEIGNITRIEYGGQPVIPTARLAEFYEASAENLRVNFFNAQKKARFVEGKHFFKLEGAALDTLRNENSDMQISPMTRSLYLWTKRGCARHAKMLNTDKAWEVFEVLEDSYFSSVVERDESLPPVTDFQRGTELAKLAPYAKDPLAKARLVAKAANLILGENFLEIPNANRDFQVSLFYRQ